MNPPLLRRRLRRERPPRCVAFAVAAAAALGAPAAAARAANVVIDGTTTYQTVDGWGTAISSGEAIYNPATFSGTANAGHVYARDLGLNIFRVYFEPNTLMGIGAVDGLDDVVNFTGNLTTDAAKVNLDQVRTRYQDEFATWLKTNVLEPDQYKVVVACWSPAHWMKESAAPGSPFPQIINFGNDTQGGTLKVSEAQQFARYSAAFVQAFADSIGRPVYGYSLQNESSFENPFNSATYVRAGGDYSRYAVALKAVRDEFNLHASLQDVKLMGPHVAGVGPEPANPWALLQQSGMINAVKNDADPTLINAIEIFTHHDYMMDLAKGAVMNSAYWYGAASVPGQPWAGWFDTATYAPGWGSLGVKSWVSEVSGESVNWLQGPGTTVGQGAITIAKRIHDAFVHGGVGGYVYWNFADAGTAPDAESLLGTTQFANPGQSKKYNAFKHFTRYVRPGMQRVKATFAGTSNSSFGGANGLDTYNSLNVSAFKSNDRQTIVLVNMRNTSESVNITVPTAPAVTSFDVFRTSATENFVQLPDVAVAAGQVSVFVPALSVVTLTGVASNAGPGGDTTPPGVEQIATTSVDGRIRAVRITFTEPMSAAQAGDASNYAIYSRGADGRQGSGKDRAVKLGLVSYDPGSRTVELQPAKPLAGNRLYHVSVAAAMLRDAAGNVLDGDGNGQAGGAYNIFVGHGSKLTYVDQDGDRVTLKLTGPGKITMTRAFAGDATLVSLDGASAGSTLTGRLKPARSTPGTTTIGAIDNPGGAQVQLGDGFAIGP
jgi:O-glycosyl hydrolase